MADFSRVAAHLANGLQEHADRDGLTGVKRAVFIDRGGHAPGEPCPSAPPPDPHFYMCRWPDDECTCHLYGHTPDPGCPHCGDLSDPDQPDLHARCQQIPDAETRRDGRDG